MKQNLYKLDMRITTHIEGTENKSTWKSKSLLLRLAQTLSNTYGHFNSTSQSSASKALLDRCSSHIKSTHIINLHCPLIIEKETILKNPLTLNS